MLGGRIISFTVGTNLTLGYSVRGCGGFSHGGCFCPSLSGGCRVSRFSGPVYLNNRVSVIISNRRGHVNIAHVRVRRSTNGLGRDNTAVDASSSSTISCGHTNMPLVRVMSRPSVHDTTRTHTCVRGLGTVLRCASIYSYGVRRNDLHYSTGVSVVPRNTGRFNAHTRVGGLGSFHTLRHTVGCRIRHRGRILRSNNRIIRRAHA